jgi:hypothetical protein
MLTFAPASSPPDILLPGYTARTDLTLGPIPAGKAAETYAGRQIIRDTSYPIKASASLDLTVQIQSDTGLDLPEGSLYQEIATTSFDNATDEKFFLSVWVCPGTSTAKLSFVESAPDGTIVTRRGIEVDKDGIAAPSGVITNSGISAIGGSIHPVHGELTRCRLFISFDYHFDISLASQTSIVVQNTSTSAASASVWFDGIQLERALYPEQIMPTTYTRKQKLVSPSKKLDISGDSNYHEW